MRFYEGIGLSRETLGFHRQTPEELAHYARACVDILFKFPFSKRDENGELKGEELEGIAARSDFDLSQHQRFSGKPMGVFDEELRTAWTKLPKEKQDDLWRRYYENRKKYLTKMAKPDETPEQIQQLATDDANALAKGNYIPHVIEPSAGVDRLILALIANAYSETTKTDDKGKSETLYVMKFHPRVAPDQSGGFAAAEKQAGTGEESAGGSRPAASLGECLLRRRRLHRQTLCPPGRSRHAVLRDD